MALQLRVAASVRVHTRRKLAMGAEADPRIMLYAGAVYFLPWQSRAK